MLTNSVSQPPALNLPPVSVAASGSNGQGSCLAHKALISVSFKCPDFGINSAVVSLANWPRYQRSIGKRSIISACVVGSLV